MSEVEQDVIEENVETETSEVDAAIVEAFNDGIEREASEDDIKLDMISAGATFKNVTRLYNQYMIDAGLSLSKEEKTAHVTTSLEGKEFATEEDFDLAVAALIDVDKGINERSAGALLRAYAKKNELEVFKKPKAETSGRTGFASVYYSWLIANPSATIEEAKNYIMNPENSVNTHRNLSHFQGIRALANGIAEKYQG